MHYLASTVLSFILSPFNWIIILLIASYFFRKALLKKTCRIMALCLFLLFGNQWLLDQYAKIWQPAPVVINSSVPYSCGIVLGGFASPDADANGYFNSASDRFIQAVKLYHTGKISRILISGGNGKPGEKSFREGAWVKTELRVLGIPDSAIFAEDRSNNTGDNAMYAKQILDSLQLRPPYLLVTSAFHMPRAALIFKKAGLDIKAFPCNYTAGRGSSDIRDLLPRPSVLLAWEPYLKEAAAYLWYKTIDN